jgi:hypothetical protein
MEIGSNLRRHGEIGTNGCSIEQKQALAMIGLFKDAGRKGWTEDYDASRLDGRVLIFCHPCSQLTPPFLT